jgi:hypothetical protein
VAFLVQFDVGLYPSKKAKNHVARVEFNLDCPGCKVYSLYPGQSSYNVANYSGSSKRTTLWGNVLTLIGFGLSASYRRQEDMLSGSLVQSVYTAGFQNGVLDDDQPRSGAHQQWKEQAEQSFGWYYGAAPFEELVSQGIHTTFAMITVPRALIYTTEDRFGNANTCMPFHIDGAWASRNDPTAQYSHYSVVGTDAKLAVAPFYYLDKEKLFKPGAAASDTPSPYAASVLTWKTNVPLPASLDEYSLIARREKQKLHVLRMEYYTVYDKNDSGSRETDLQTAFQTNTKTTNAENRQN